MMTFMKKILKEMNSLAAKYPSVDIFHARVKVIDEKNNTAFYTASCPEFETVAEFIWHRLKNYRMHYAPDFMCKTDSLRKIGGFVNFPNAWGSDDATWLLLANQNGIVASSKILCNWRQSSINLSRKDTIENKLIAVSAYVEWLKDFIENKMNIRENEKDLLIDIKKNIKQRVGVQQAGALKIGIRPGNFQYIKLLYNWIKFKKKYSLQLFSLVWAAMLLKKDLINTKD